MSLVHLVLILCTFNYVSLADVELGDPRTVAFIDAFLYVSRAPPGIAEALIDPLYINFLSGSFATLQYRNYNSTVTGLSDCVAGDFVLSADGRVLNFALDCPGYTLYSANEVHGYLLYKTIEGRGTLQIDYGRYIVRVYATLNYLKDAYGNVYYQIGNYFLDIEVVGPNYYNFMHLFNNNRIQNEELNALANNNWKTVAVFSCDPVWYPIMNRVVASMNKYLQTRPIQLL